MIAMLLHRDGCQRSSPGIGMASFHRATRCKGEAAMITNSSRTFRNAIDACRSYFEHHRSVAQVRELDDQMLRRFV
jgi:hypothetical protein